MNFHQVKIQINTLPIWHCVKMCNWCKLMPMMIRTNNFYTTHGYALPDLTQKRRGYDMSITQRYIRWYVGKFGLPLVWFSVVSTQIKHPVFSTHLVLHSFQYSNTGKWVFDYSYGKFKVSAYSLIERKETVFLIYPKLEHMIFQWQPQLPTPSSGTHTTSWFQNVDEMTW